MSKDQKPFEELDLLVIEWARERGILPASDAKTQMLKCVSEVGELADAIAKGNFREIVDGLGDTVVTLILVAEILQLDLTECLEIAYKEIADRKGKMVNGIFIKEEV